MTTIIHPGTLGTNKNQKRRHVPKCFVRKMLEAKIFRRFSSEYFEFWSYHRFVASSLSAFLRYGERTEDVYEKILTVGGHENTV